MNSSHELIINVNDHLGRFNSSFSLALLIASSALQPCASTLHLLCISSACHTYHLVEVNEIKCIVQPVNLLHYRTPKAIRENSEE